MDFYKSQATLFDTGANFEVPFSPEFVREVVGDSFPPGSKLVDATEFGFAVHAEPGGAVALVAFNKPAAFAVVTHAPDAQVRGEFRTSQNESSALINQGATGTAWCKPIEDVKRLASASRARCSREIARRGSRSPRVDARSHRDGDGHPALPTLPLLAMVAPEGLTTVKLAGYAARLLRFGGPLGKCRATLSALS